ncbi:hypothetical protein GMSM_37430 [Geomonas sp. Red276]
MKKVLLLVFVACAFLALGGTAMADDLSFGLGVKGWYNDFKFAANNSGNNFTVKTKDPALMIGPTAKIGYGKYFAGVTYLTSATDYKLENSTEKVSRDDIDVLVGYMLIPQFGIVGGYKAIFLEGKYPGGTEKFKKQGGVLGVTGNVPLPLGLAVYGNLGGLYLTQEYTDTNFQTDLLDRDYYGFSVEAGLGYRIIAGLSANLGYKYQGLYMIKKHSTDTSFDETYQGLTFGVDYRF